MGANPEHKVEHSGGHEEPIAWIGREHAPIERLPSENSTTVNEGSGATIVQLPATDTGMPGRSKRTLGVVGVIIALAVAIAVWMHYSAPPMATKLWPPIRPSPW